jgi:hypothetical protein
MGLACWRELADGGGDLVACLDFPGTRAEAGFGDLAAGVGGDGCFLHLEPPGPGPVPLAVRARCWAGELAGTGRAVRAVLGYCAGTALATVLADAVAAGGAGGVVPLVVLLDAVPVTGESLAGQFTTVLEASARHLTGGELEGARALAADLAGTGPGDLAAAAGVLAGRYDQLMGAVAARLSLHQALRRELSATFAAYLDYLLLASEGGFGLRAGIPLFLTSAGFEAPVPDARVITVGAAHADLLRDPAVHDLIAGLLTGEDPW